ncbi:hypothetical protein SmJEL517_g04112 [Synchytrium microbalum]|uniref:cyclin-dependent kinase n=1 Tax=Synchytrium microbalum TaxID=1806994 RepID=A0A507C5J7_9FUNG|nr:uncharacterized protein SmJEL517_g04112 [Synchytrium microbalum]TPX32823.1 hypothetical protein SmJEL517_g04112 [Synchytrium microbalum]
MDGDRAPAPWQRGRGQAFGNNFSGHRQNNGWGDNNNRGPRDNNPYQNHRGGGRFQNNSRGNGSPHGQYHGDQRQPDYQQQQQMHQQQQYNNGPYPPPPWQPHQQQPPYPQYNNGYGDPGRMPMSAEQAYYQQGDQQQAPMNGWAAPPPPLPPQQHQMHQQQPQQQAIPPWGGVRYGVPPPPPIQPPPPMPNSQQRMLGEPVRGPPPPMPAFASPSNLNHSNSNNNSSVSRNAGDDMEVDKDTTRLSLSAPPSGGQQKQQGGGMPQKTAASDSNKPKAAPKFAGKRNKISMSFSKSTAALPKSKLSDSAGASPSDDFVQKIPKPKQPQSNWKKTAQAVLSGDKPKTAVLPEMPLPSQVVDAAAAVALAVAAADSAVGDQKVVAPLEVESISSHGAADTTTTITTSEVIVQQPSTTTSHDHPIQPPSNLPTSQYPTLPTHAFPPKTQPKRQVNPWDATSPLPMNNAMSSNSGPPIIPHRPPPPPPPVYNQPPRANAWESGPAPLPSQQQQFKMSQQQQRLSQQQQLPPPPPPQSIPPSQLPPFPPSPSNSPWHQQHQPPQTKEEMEASMDEPTRLTYIPVTTTLGHYERLNQVGEGTYGTVYKARDKRNQALVALKKVRIEPDKDGFPITGIREIKILTTLHHPNIVKLNEIVSSRDRIDLVFEYMDHDLTGLFANTAFKPSPAHIKCLMLQMFEGLRFLHSKNIMHRDLKGSNLLISKEGALKIADFGLARYLAKSLPHKGQLREMDYTNRVITLWYRPPELLMGATKYGAEIDMWSAGVVFLEFFIRKTVFPGESEITQLESITKICGSPDSRSWPDMHRLPWYDMMLKGKPPHSSKLHIYKDTMSKLAFELMEWLLQMDPKKRPTAEEALNHPYFREEPQACELDELQAILPIEDWHEWESKKRKEAWREERRHAPSPIDVTGWVLPAAPKVDSTAPSSIVPSTEITPVAGKPPSSVLTSAKPTPKLNAAATGTSVTPVMSAAQAKAEAFKQRMKALVTAPAPPPSQIVEAVPSTPVIEAPKMVVGEGKKAEAKARKAEADGGKKELQRTPKKATAVEKQVKEGDKVKEALVERNLDEEKKASGVKSKKVVDATTAPGNKKFTIKLKSNSQPSTPTDSPQESKGAGRTLKLKAPKPPNVISNMDVDVFDGEDGVPYDGTLDDAGIDMHISASKKKRRRGVLEEVDDGGGAPTLSKKAKKDDGASTKSRRRNPNNSSSTVNNTTTSRHASHSHRTAATALGVPPAIVNPFPHLDAIDATMPTPPIYQPSPPREQRHSSSDYELLEKFSLVPRNVIANPVHPTVASAIGYEHINTISLE